MNNPKFYIYGVPDGFNMLSGTPDEILYYQLFYDTSKRGREMRINRKANGETVYSYLIYNLVSCKGREGAFLGMSIVFTGNEYCNNPVSLKELFDGVFNEVILKSDDKDKIISAIEGANTVGRFCISKFVERQDMCEKIGRIIINNVVGELANSISTIDNSFDNSKEGRMLTLPFEADNTSINQALRSYTWVSLSFDSSQQIADSQDLLSVHFINELTKKVGSHKDFIIQGLKGLVSTDDIMAKRQEINHCLNTIEEYIGRQPELRKLRDDYMSIYNELDNLKPLQSKELLQPEPEISPSFDNDDNSDWLKMFIQKNQKKIIASVCSVFLLGIVSVGTLWISDNSKSTSKYAKTDVMEKTERGMYNDTTGLSSGAETEVMEEEGGDSGFEEFNNNEFYLYLNNADYSAAWGMLQQVADDKIREKYALALQNSYKCWLKEEIERRQRSEQKLSELANEIAHIEFNIDDINQYKERIKKQIKELRDASNEVKPEETKKVKKDQGKGVIVIYEASDTYEKGKAISVKDGKITCKRKSFFVIEGINKFSYKDKDLEVVPEENYLKIRVKGVGSKNLKLTKDIEYTFNVTN